MTGSSLPPVDWSDPRWQAHARDWVAGWLGRAGRRVTGPAEARVRPWSLVWRVPTDAGPYWFKANNAGTRFEAGLLGALARIAPGRVPEPVAVDADLGWSLLPDGGETLRDALARHREPAVWERVLTGYAALQRAVAPRVDEMLAVGVPDHRPEAMPELFAGLLDDPDALLVGAPDGLTPETLARLRRFLPEYTERCRRLAATGVPASVQHDDLHDGNVFAADHRFFDWGDASVAHPFGTLLVTLNSVAHSFELPDGDPVLLRLRDAYLEPWTDRYDRADLREVAGLAVTVAKVSRALSWRRALCTPDPTRAEYAAAVPGWLGELFEPDRL
ncbi:aminoglycoside phosphotransferase family protein [Micromonospora sp. ATCC 39149]|uniref:Aminoglycoside phosphotransferase family protein n=1 Tax=Micromonospora carbonacea TaxID=47853 RepID=A0A7D6CBS9_9ACTN|nr:aminoglycoside phosphotransferase family protein [Micromonospora sp. ATCC 39149]QLJ98545.1 aminoglycoside phosphotransferase family protein [Micromonospora carbonacea]